MNRRSFWSFIQKKSTRQDKKHSVIFLTFHHCANNLYQCNLKFFWVYRAQYLQKLSLFTFSDLNNTENLQMTLFICIGGTNGRQTSTDSLPLYETDPIYGNTASNFQNWSKLVLKCPNVSKHGQKCPNQSKLIQTCPNVSEIIQRVQTFSN